MANEKPRGQGAKSSDGLKEPQRDQEGGATAVCQQQLKRLAPTLSKRGDLEESLSHFTQGAFMFEGQHENCAQVFSPETSTTAHAGLASEHGKVRNALGNILSSEVSHEFPPQTFPRQPRQARLTTHLHRNIHHSQLHNGPPATQIHVEHIMITISRSLTTRKLLLPVTQPPNANACAPAPPPSKR